MGLLVVKKGNCVWFLRGSRVDIVAGILPPGKKRGSARIFIDGKPVSQNKSLYTITRPSAGPGTWFPLVRRIEHKSALIPETWTLKVTAVNSDSTVWSFDVYGSKTGFDGSGTSDRSFVSKSESCNSNGRFYVC